MSLHLIAKLTATYIMKGCLSKFLLLDISCHLDERRDLFGCFQGAKRDSSFLGMTTNEKCPSIRSELYFANQAIRVYLPSTYND
jgi:hypothetical protein